MVVDGSGVTPITSDLGWQITLTTCRVALSNLVFTTAGEYHDDSVASLGDSLRRLLIADAWAHPGHAAGGEVIGELPGRFVVDWCQGDGVTLGEAEFTVGDYNGANFEFTRGSAEDGLDADDPLVGHTIEIGGTAVLGDQTITFHAVLDQDEGREIVGLPFDLDIDESSMETLGLQFLPQSPFSDDDLFDQIDFAAADPDGDGVVEFIVGDEGHTRLVRSTQSHDYYFIQPYE